MVDNRNLILAIVLAVAIMFGSDYLMGKLRPPAPPPQPGAPAAVTAAPPPQAPGVANTAAPVPAAAPAAASAEKPRQRGAILADSPRLKIDSPRIKGSINLIGARFDDVVFVDYRQAADKNSPPVELFSPAGAPDAYFAEFGWVGQGVVLPGPETTWSASAGVLTPETPVTLSWNNGAGLVFTRTIGLDRNYLFTITEKVENVGGQPVALNAYGLISRTGTPKTDDFYILHEGPLGVLEGTLTEFKYADLAGKGTAQQRSTGGWLGITDKYWIAALVLDDKAPSDVRFSHRRTEKTDKYQTDFLGATVSVPAGGAASATHLFFAGAKEYQLLKQYEAAGIKRFDLAIDFGWFPFLTKPMSDVLHYFRVWLGNMGLAILLLTVVIKGLMFPLANKSYVAMSKMKKLQPEMTKLRERFGEDKQRMNQELMALYKREKVNPAAGCLPIVVQIPVFFALYKVLFVNIEMRHAPFFGWIQDLSAPDPTSLFNLFGLIPFDPPAYLMIGVWPLIMGVTMWLQQKLNPQPADPIQAKMFMFLPIIFTFMLGQFAAGLVIYWAWNNVLSIIQQWAIMRRMGVKA